MFKQIGIGIDIADIEKFEKIKYEKKPKFYSKIFSPSEIAYCLKFKNPYERFAGKFAIKEATIKAIKENVGMLDIETSHVRSKPIVKIKNMTKYQFQISISHEKKIAVAVVISFKKNEN